MLNLLLSSLLFIFLLNVKGELAPLAEEARHILHAVVRVEQSSHGIQKVLVPVQVFFLLDELQLEARPHRFVLQRVVVLDVIDQLFEEIAAVVDLEQCCILLVRVD